MKLALTTASGVRMVNWISKLKGETGPGAPNDALVSGEITDAKIREMRKDPRYKTYSPKHDPDYRARVDNLAKQHQGS